MRLIAAYIYMDDTYMGKLGALYVICLKTIIYFCLFVFWHANPVKGFTNLNTVVTVVSC